MRKGLLPFLFACSILATVACLQTRESSRAATFSSVSEFLDNNPLKKGALPIRLFAQGEHLTVNLVTPTEPLKAHYHETHEETVYLVRGRGLLRLGAEKKQMKAGDLAHIPKRLIHGFTPEGKDCLAISIFGPAFDGKDRIFVSD